MYILPINGVIGEDFKYQDLLMHLNAAKNEQIIKLIINSPGGYTDEAEKIETALLKSKKIFHSTNSGDVASAAVQLFLVPNSENRTFNPSKGSFLIHMPFLDPFDGGATGTAEEIDQVAKGMKELETQMIKKYSKATGVDVNVLEGFMKENIPLTTEQIKQLGFANIVQPELKAVAYYKFKNDKMSKELEEKLSGFEKLLNKVVATISPKPKNLMVQDVNGNELDFGDEIEEISQVTTGTQATVNGQSANGEYILADGSALIFENGSVSEIKPAMDEQMAVLKNENETLKAELEALKSEKEKAVSDSDTFRSEAEKQLADVKNELIKIKALASKGKEGNPGVPSGVNGGEVTNRIKKHLKQ